jgi:hypothetical protein
MSWTPERKRKLAMLWTAGLSCSQIAAQIGGVSKNAVIGKRVRMGLPDRAAPTKTHRSGKPITTAQTRTKPIPRQPKPAAAPPPTHKQIGAQRGEWNKRYSESSDRFHCQRFVAEESGVDGLVCGRAKTHGSWCEQCRSDIFQPLRLADAA